MKHGLVAGKFMPLHLGHVALVRFAAAHCDELLIVVTANPQDAIPADQRLNWVQEEFRRYVKIKIILIELKVTSSTPEAWARGIAEHCSTINLVFGSNDSGEFLAKAVHASYVSFDPERKEFPILGREIRQHPFRHWELIAVPARGYFVKRICFYGPESTGKSTLARRLASHYQTEFVPEVAREFISSNQFSVDDIVTIAKEQTERILGKTAIANKVLFCDTDLITTEIYSDVYLREIPTVLKEFEIKIRYDKYFLFDIDVPWVADGLRDLGEKRQEMFQRFRNELDKRGIQYVLLSGSHVERERAVLKFVDNLLAD